MKAYINIKNDSDLHSHQTLNKRIGLMKRERQHNAAHRFSFGKRFDETLMKLYFISYQCIILSNHQFIGISPLNKSIEETAAPSLPVCPCADRQLCRHNGTEYHANRSVGHPTCLLSDRPTRKSVSYRRQEKVCLYRWYSHRLLETEKP